MNDMTTRRWLAVSAVANLFLLCVIAGGAWRLWSAPPPAVAGEGSQSRGLRYAADALGAEQRRAFLVGLRKARDEVAPAIEEAQAGRQQVLGLIAAPSLDRAAIQSTLARTREADTAVRARVEASVVDFAATLAPADRAVFAAGLARRSLLATDSNKSTR